MERPNTTIPSWLTHNTQWLVSSFQASARMAKPAGGVGEAPYRGLADPSAGWTPVSATVSTIVGPFINLHALHNISDGMVYLARRQNIEATGEWDLLLGHDGGVRAFVDGKCVLAEPTLRGPLLPRRSRARLTLERGAHEIAIAFDLAAGYGWGIMLEVRQAEAPDCPQPIVISDMRACLPAEALSDRAELGHWKVLPYQAAGFSGTCIRVFPDAGAPELRLPLNARGWHAVYLGLGGLTAVHGGPGNGILAKLTGDAAYQPRAQKYGYDEEVLLQCADLTGRDLLIAQQSKGIALAACLHYVKLVPMSDAEVDTFQADRRQRETKRLIATLDGYSFLYERMSTTREELLVQFEHLRGSDIGTIWWQYGGADLTNYPTRVGRMIARSETDSLARRGDGDAAQALKTLVAQGIHLTRFAVDTCHAMDIKINICLRPAAWVCPPPLEDGSPSRFYAAHPEWRCRDRDGTPIARMSFAVPEVRRHLLDVLREVLEAEPDGLCMLFNRATPVVFWEDAFCDRFRATYGEDARQVPENDPRLLDLRAAVMTEWMREVRNLMDDFQRKRGLKKRLDLAAMCMGTESDNRLSGLDVPLWVREGLIDQIGIWQGRSLKPLDIPYYRQIVAGTQVSIFPCLTGWMTPSYEDAMRSSLEWRAAGADGILVWDAETGKVKDGLMWPVFSRLGHEAELRARLAKDGIAWPTTGNIQYTGGPENASRWMANEGF